MNVLILGIDGYIGKALAIKLKSEGHGVVGIDNFSRRDRASGSLVPTGAPGFRPMNLLEMDLAMFKNIDTIVHLAEQPSASWSMQSYEHSLITQEENCMGTLRLLWQMRKMFPEAHLVKLGSMGEYGTPDCYIPEGYIEEGPMRGLQFPRSPGSFYHLSKVFDSMNIKFACDTWGLRSTDIMQGIVFGLNTWDSPGELTRFDYDEHFGTVINRFCVQAISGIPLTIYGTGDRMRSFLPLKDSIECLTLAITNPADPGEYRVFNQYAQAKTIKDIAQMVQYAGKSLDLDVWIENIDNPRKEVDNTWYDTTNKNLKEIGYAPYWSLLTELTSLMEALLPFKDRVNKDVIQPKTTWE